MTKHFTKLVGWLQAQVQLQPKKRPAQQHERDILFGEQDMIDVTMYAGLQEQADYVCVDGVYMRTLAIVGYPFVASSGWMDSLITFHHDSDMSYHLHEVNAHVALPKLQRKITELESMRRAMVRDGKIVGSEISDPLESAIELRDKIQRGQEKLFQLAVYVCVRADSKAELDKTTRLLEANLSAQLFYAKVARYQQLEALQAIMPRGDDQLAQRRNLDSSSAALTFPFMSSELVHETGILYGVNVSNNSLVIVDRFCLPNADSITFAQSGAGKSYTTKVEIIRQLMQGTRVIVIDPEREYQRLTESCCGTYIKLSTRSKQKINPFDTATTYRDTDGSAEHMQDVMEIISLMVEGLSAREKAAVDKALVGIYKKAKQQPPLLADLYAELRKRRQTKLCEKLEKYVSGSLAHVFNEPTNVTLDNRLVVFDIKDMPENLRQIMMLIIAHFVNHRVMAHPAKHLLVIDEGWLLLQHEESARFVAGLVRRVRKYYLGVSIISQQANDFLHNEYGRAIASQSAMRILMRQDTTTIKGVVDEFGLSEYEHSFLLTCERGDALLIADQQHVAVKIVAAEHEHPCITTDPAEVYGT